MRYLELPQTIRPLAVTPPLRILGMIAGPSDLPALDPQVERQRLERAIAPLQAKGLVELRWLEGATWRDLQRAMRREAWHIFHFVGHGDFDPRRDEGLIAFCNDVEKAHLLTAGDLGRLLADHRTLRLAVLNACLGAQGSNRDLFASTAATLVRRGILAVVAMQQAITDAAAIEFTQTFYESLADGLPVDAAMSEARKAISFAITNTLEWGTPVLYSRASDGHLFNWPSFPLAGPASDAIRTGTPANTPVAATNLPGRGEEESQKPQPSVAPSRKMDAPPIQPVSLAAQPVESRPATVVKRTPAAGEEQTIRTAGTDFSFVYVPAGPFQMGSNDYSDEQPIHTMPVEAFWLGKTPITNAQFRTFIDGGGYTNRAFWTESGWQWRTGRKITQPSYWTDNKWNTPQQPVVGVSWYEATAYAAWLAQAMGQAIRLPTEAEWEKGARGTDGRKYPWGNEAPDKNRCNFNVNEDKTTPVGSYPTGASLYGALDMAGNVWEWTATKWIGNYENYANVVDNDKEGSATRSLRGGGWNSDADGVRSASRAWNGPTIRNNFVGFRLVVFAPGG